MKIIFISLMLLSFLYSDEMQRIEAIVEDISELRANYEECEDKLKSIHMAEASSSDKEYERLYKEEKRKNLLLKAENQAIKELKNKNKELEKQLNFHNNLLLSKEKTIQKMMNNGSLCKDENKFPKLMMKKENENNIETFKATSFHLLTDSVIYDDINGKAIDKWSKKTSFTSNTKTENWIKISGYFVDKKWRKAQKNMWIELSKVTKK